MNKNLYFKGFSHAFGRVPKPTAQRLNESIQNVRSSVGQGLSRLFEDILPAERIKGRQIERQRLYDSRVTLWAMLGQVFSQQSSLRDAVRELQAMDCLAGRSKRGSNTGCYCKARQRLSLQTVTDLHARVCEKIPSSFQINTTPTPKGRLLSVDGTCVRLDDTDANREVYPYSSSQPLGCSYPLMQLVALKDLNNGTLIDAVDSPSQSGESPLFCQGLMHHLRPHDTLLADRAYCSYHNFVKLNEIEAQAVMRLHASRDQTALKHSDDVVVTWTKPSRKDIAAHVTDHDYAQLPETLKVRLVRYRIERKGFRTQEVLLATTVFDLSVSEIAQLYARRWEIETGFRHIKATLNMDHIHVKSPELGRKLVHVFFIAHNLIYWLMHKAGCAANTLSFKGTVSCVQQWAKRMAHLGKRKFADLLDEMLEIIGADHVPIRPNRSEPRCIKTRIRKYPKLTSNRHTYKVLI